MSTDATTPAADRDATAHEREALEGAVSERILDGSLRDAHGEIDIDPDVPGATEQHREDVAAIESPDGPAADETLGTTVDDHPRSKRPDRRR